MPRLDGMSSRALHFDVSDTHLQDVDGIATDVATLTEADVLTAGELDGVNVCGAGFDHLLSWPCVTTSAVVGAYVEGSAIVFTGTYGGVATTRTALLTDADGGETALLADGPLDLGSVTRIDIEAQADTDGEFDFGWSGVAPQPGRDAWRCVARGTGNLHVTNGGSTEEVTVPLTANIAHEAWTRRIFGDSTVDVTAYE